MAGDLEKIARDYWRAVQRIRRLPMPLAARLAILADLEVMYRRERAGKLGAVLAQLHPRTGHRGP